MMREAVIVEKEIPSAGGWQKSEFQKIAEFSSADEAEKYLVDNGFRKAGSALDVFWHEPVDWPWARYRVKTPSAA